MCGSFPIQDRNGPYPFNISSLNFFPFLVSSYSLPIFCSGLRHTAMPILTKCLRMSLVLLRLILSLDCFASLEILLGILGLSMTLMMATLCIPLTSQLYNFQSSAVLLLLISNILRFNISIYTLSRFSHISLCNPYAGYTERTILLEVFNKIYKGRRFFVSEKANQA